MPKKISTVELLNLIMDTSDLSDEQAHQELLNSGFTEEDIARANKKILATINKLKKKS